MVSELRYSSDMPRLQRTREILSDPLTAADLELNASQGWKPVAVIWEREVADDEPAIADIAEPVPYGLKIAEDCVALEQDMQEREALLVMLEMIIQDKPLSETAEELNRRGFRYPAQFEVDAWVGVRYAPAPYRSGSAGFQYTRVGGSAGQTYECELSKLS